VCQAAIFKRADFFSFSNFDIPDDMFGVHLEDQRGGAVAGDQCDCIHFRFAGCRIVAMQCNQLTADGIRRLREMQDCFLRIYGDPAILSWGECAGLFRLRKKGDRE